MSPRMGRTGGTSARALGKGGGVSGPLVAPTFYNGAFGSPEQYGVSVYWYMVSYLGGQGGSRHTYNATDGKLYISWQNGDATAQTRIYRSTDNSTFTLIYTTGAGETSYSNEGLNSYTRYYYKLTHYKNGKEGPYTSSGYNNDRTYHYIGEPAGTACESNSDYRLSTYTYYTYNNTTESWSGLLSPSCISTTSYGVGSGQTYIVPDGVTNISFSGQAGSGGGYGGAGGATVGYMIDVTPGQTIIINVGAKGASGQYNGANTTITRNGSTILTLYGGQSAEAGARGGGVTSTIVGSISNYTHYQGYSAAFQLCQDVTFYNGMVSGELASMSGYNSQQNCNTTNAYDGSRGNYRGGSGYNPDWNRYECGPDGDNTKSYEYGSNRFGSNTDGIMYIIANPYWNQVVHYLGGYTSEEGCSGFDSCCTRY